MKGLVQFHPVMYPGDHYRVMYLIGLDKSGALWHGAVEGEAPHMRVKWSRISEEMPPSEKPKATPEREVGDVDIEPR